MRTPSASFGSYELSIDTGHGDSWSPEALEILGLPPGTSLTRHTFIHQIVHEDDREHFNKQIEAGFIKGQAIDCELRVVLPDQSVRHVRNLATAHGEDGRIECIAGTLVLLQNEDDSGVAAFAKENLKLLLNSASEGIIIVEHGLIIEANHAACSMVGYTGTELNSGAFLDLIHTEDQSRLSVMISAGRGDALKQPPTVRIVGKSGLECWVSIRWVIGTWNSRTALVIFLTDISDQKTIEAELDNARRLGTAGRIAGQVAHDFNNLLSPLIAYPALLMQENNLSQNAREMLKEMELSASRLAETNQQLLTLGRRGHYAFKPLRLNELVHQVLVGQSIPSEVIVREHFASNVPLIRASSTQIARAFSNLLKNAVESIQGKGEVLVCTEVCHLHKSLPGYESVNPGSYVRLEVKDNGRGMTEDVKEKLFTPFFSTKSMDGQKGTGLGLSVVEGIIEDHKGYIVVDSAVGQGTAFSCYFPASKEGEFKVSDTQARLKGGTEKILVVDDDPSQCRVATHLLEKLGYLVSTAGSGEIALEIVAKSEYDLIIIDMIMDGGIDGAEAYRRILKTRPGQKAIILSGNNMSERAKRALDLGAGTFVPKPVSQRVLANAVRRELDKKPRPGAIPV